MRQFDICRELLCKNICKVMSFKLNSLQLEICNLYVDVDVDVCVKNQLKIVQESS